MVNVDGYEDQAKEIINKMVEEKIPPNEYLFREMLIRMCEKGFPDNKILGVFDLMDSLKVKYNHQQLNPTLHAMVVSAPQARADLAWEVLRRAMLQRFDLKTLLPKVKAKLKELGLMHPIENGEIKSINTNK